MATVPSHQLSGRRLRKWPQQTVVERHVSETHFRHHGLAKRKRRELFGSDRSPPGPPGENTTWRGSRWRPWCKSYYLMILKPDALLLSASSVVILFTFQFSVLRPVPTSSPLFWGSCLSFHCNLFFNLFNLGLMTTVQDVIVELLQCPQS